MDSLSGKTNEYRHVTLDHHRLPGVSLLEQEGTGVVYAACGKWRSWGGSCRWQLSHDLLLGPGSGMSTDHTAPVYGPGQASSTDDIDLHPYSG